MRLAIVGSRSFLNEKKIRKFIELFIKRYGQNITIISGGCQLGADALAKKVALEMGLKYIEYAPVHQSYNEYCIDPPECYNKAYHVSNFFTRNTQIAESCNYLAAFTMQGVKCNGTMDTYRKAQSAGKPCFLHEEPGG